ncbi:hypothetical protein POP12_038 [Pectobacterium phage POP12]|nr:hypothetical protein POP12_038 [Pectobacterium phage POP12]
MNSKFDILKTGKRGTLIGSRRTVERIDNIAVKLGSALSDQGVLSYSGGAPGMDSNFMLNYSPERRKIIIPSDNAFGMKHNGKDIIDFQTLDVMKAREIVEQVAGNFHSLESGMQDLYSRNVVQVLGETLDNPTDFVLFWAPEQNFSVQGGTKIAVRVARMFNVPCFNLWRDDVLETVCKMFDIQTKRPNLDFLWK